jgi:hypothetical protein
MKSKTCGIVMIACLFSSCSAWELNQASGGAVSLECHKASIFGCCGLDCSSFTSQFAHLERSTASNEWTFCQSCCLGCVLTDSWTNVFVVCLVLGSTRLTANDLNFRQCQADVSKSPFDGD